MDSALCRSAPTEPLVASWPYRATISPAGAFGPYEVAGDAGEDLHFKGKGAHRPSPWQRQSAGPWLGWACAARPRRIPAASSPPAVRHDGRADGRGIAPRRRRGDSETIHDDRKSWLNRVAADMAQPFEALGAPFLDRIRVAIGFTSATRRSRAIGE